MDDGVEYIYSAFALNSKKKFTVILKKGKNYYRSRSPSKLFHWTKKVRFNYSDDCYPLLSGYWLAVKQDANPGFINDAWAKVNEPAFSIRGQLLKTCWRKDHGFMPIVGYR